MFGARIAKPTVSFVDDYCELYKSLFPEVKAEAILLAYYMN